jgi:hypothetical protein
MALDPGEARVLFKADRHLSSLPPVDRQGIDGDDLRINVVEEEEVLTCVRSRKASPVIHNDKAIDRDLFVQMKEDISRRPVRVMSVMRPPMVDE